MEHTIKLQPKYYNFMLKGTKRIELRLFDEKRKFINLGDTLKILKEPDLKESFDTKVVGLLRYNSFEEMFEDFEQFYTKEKQQQNGVLGIRIEIK